MPVSTHVLDASDGWPASSGGAAVVTPLLAALRAADDAAKKVERRTTAVGATREFQTPRLYRTSRDVVDRAGVR